MDSLFEDCYDKTVLISDDSDTDATTEDDHESKPHSSNLQWTDTIKQPHIIPYSKTPGLKISMNNKYPMDFFDLIFSQQLYDLIITQTNTYALEELSKSESENSRINRWKDVNKREMRIWLGLLFHMGTIRTNKMQDYWKKDRLFDIPIFSKFMGRDRFLIILSLLHFNYSEEDLGTALISPLINFFNHRMNTVYEAHKNLSIESMVFWRGRMFFEQHMKVKYRVKLYTLREANGLALKLVPYGGSSDEELSGKGHINKVVEKLLEGKMSSGHSMYLNDYYNSVNLTRKLLEQNTYVTGTLRTNRNGNPIKVMTKRLKKGECVSQYADDGICVSKWKDRQEVLMISSEFDGVLRATQNSMNNTVIKPNLVIEYNKYMAGVDDRHDQMLAYYPCENQTFKWYKKIAIHIFQSILLNSWHLYNSQNSQDMSFYDFRLSVIKGLLDLEITIIERPVGKVHIPKNCPKDANNRRIKRRRCKQCWNTYRKKKLCIYYCEDCPDMPGLCLEPCFKLFHKY